LQLAWDVHGKGETLLPMQILAEAAYVKVGAAGAASLGLLSAEMSKEQAAFRRTQPPALAEPMQLRARMQEVVVSEESPSFDARSEGRFPTITTLQNLDVRTSGPPLRAIAAVLPQLRIPLGTGAGQPDPDFQRFWGRFPGTGLPESGAAGFGLPAAV